MKPIHLLLSFTLLAACGGTSDDPAGSNGSNGSNGTNGSNGGGSSSFSSTNIATGDVLAEESSTTAELDYRFRSDERTVVVRISDGEDRLNVTIRDPSPVGQYLTPGTYEVYGTGADREGDPGSSDVGAYFGGREYYVNPGEGTLTIESHDNQRIRGRLQVDMQPTGSSTPSHAVEASFDARYVMPTIDGLEDGGGEIRFSDSILLMGAARVEDEGDTLRIVVEDEASGSVLSGGIPKTAGAAQAGVYGGSVAGVRGQLVRETGSTSYNDDGGGSVEIVSTEGGVLVGRLNFSGRGRTSSGSGFSVSGVRADFRAPLP